MKDYHDELRKLKRNMIKQNSVLIELPNRFAFKEHNIYNFDHILSTFDWSLKNVQVKIDLTKTTTANYQSLSLLVSYAWFLKSNGCTVSFIENNLDNGASKMWKLMGARGLFPVLFSDKMNFRATKNKPLFAVRNTDDFKNVIESSEDYVDEFDVEYTNTLRYMLSELLYNTLEHGVNYGSEHIKKIRIPSIAQFTWYMNSNEIHFIISDTGVGIKKHLEQTYPGQESDVEAIKYAIRPQVSGTFSSSDPYKEKNNAGMGMYLSTNIIRRLNADMYVVSGNGVLHVSPRDVTGKTIESEWKGTFVLVTIKIEADTTFNLHQAMQEFRTSALNEQKKGDKSFEKDSYYLNIFNYFGSYAEDKDSAKKVRDERLFIAIKEEKTILIDFERVTSAPHSFLNALLASPIQLLGLQSYKKIKIVNASPEIRETIDFILDDNTE